MGVEERENSENDGDWVRESDRMSLEIGETSGFLVPRVQMARKKCCIPSHRNGMLQFVFVDYEWDIRVTFY